MNIYQAAKKSMGCKRGIIPRFPTPGLTIRRQSWEPGKQVAVTREKPVLHLHCQESSYVPAGFWEPTSEDIVAVDWEVVGQADQTKK